MISKKNIANKEKLTWKNIKYLVITCIEDMVSSIYLLYCCYIINEPNNSKKDK